MIIGQIDENDDTIKLDLDLRCIDCRKKVPGGVKTSKKYHRTEKFKTELKNFKESYLCGICRDRHRVKEKKTK